MKNNKQVILLLLTLFVSTFFVNAQEETTDKSNTETPVKIGFKVGYSLGELSSETENIYTQDYASTSGIDWGITFEFEITDLISVQPEINFTQRGGERNGYQPVTGNELSEQLNQFLPFIGMPLITDANPLYATFDSESELKYLEIPVLAKFGWGNDFRVFAEVGPYVGILLSAKQNTSGNSQFFFDAEGTNPVFVPNPSGNPPFIELPAQSLDAKTDTKDDLRTVNFGGILGLGLSKKINSKSEVFLDVRAAYGFNAIQFEEQFGQSHIGGVVFSLGYAYKIR